MSKSDQDHANSETVDSGKREFLRKATYTAPALITLGIASHSRNALGQFGNPPSAPNSETNSEDEQLLNDLEEQTGKD